MQLGKHGFHKRRQLIHRNGFQRFNQHRIRWVVWLQQAGQIIEQLRDRLILCGIAPVTQHLCLDVIEAILVELPVGEAIQHQLQ